MVEDLLPRVHCKCFGCKIACTCTWSRDNHWFYPFTIACDWLQTFVCCFMLCMNHAKITENNLFHNDNCQDKKSSFSNYSKVQKDLKVNDSK